MAAANFTVSWDGRRIEEKGAKAADAAHIRELAASGLLDEVRITWRPCILGGKSAPAITGLGEDFLPQGIVLDLLKLERVGDECVAKYRVRRTRRMSPVGPIP